MIRPAGALLLVLLAAACGEKQSSSASGSAPGAPATASGNSPSSNPEQYQRDRDRCQAQVDNYMKTRRSPEVFGGDYGAYGSTTLANDMSNYTDDKRSGRLVSTCMEQRGWTQPERSWFPKFGS